MKPQDVIFITLFLLIFVSRKHILFVYFGLLSLLVAIPLYYYWIFFTGSRLVIYAGISFLTFLILSLIASRKVQ